MLILKYCKPISSLRNPTGPLSKNISTKAILLADAEVENSYLNAPACARRVHVRSYTKFIATSQTSTIGNIFANNVSLFVRDAFANLLPMQSSVRFANVFHCQHFALYGMLSYIHTCTYLCTYVHVYMHSYVYTYIHMIHTYNAHAYIHTYVRTYKHACIHSLDMCIHLYVHTYNTYCCMSLYLCAGGGTSQYQNSNCSHSRSPQLLAAHRPLVT